jgi:hypothetical protein
MANPNLTAGIPAKGVVVPKSAGKADMSGERMEKRKGGVAMGMADKAGKDSQFDTGKTEGICYSHQRHAGDKW